MIQCPLAPEVLPVILLDALLLAVATLVLARAARAAGLPPLLGMIVAGATVGLALGVLPVSEMPSLGPLGGLRLAAISSELRLAVLALVLLRAGLGISPTQLREAGGLGLRLGTLPLIGDAAAVTLAGVFLLDLPPASALVLGCLVGAISPAIVIPGLLDLVDRWKEHAGHRRLLTSLLVGAPLDNICALVAMGVALDAALLGKISPGAFAGDLAWKIGLGVVLGVSAGFGTGAVLRRLDRGSAAARAGFCWVCAAGLVAAGQRLDLSFVLAILAFGMVLRVRAPAVAAAIEAPLRRAWDLAQYALFGLIGMAVDLGPLAQAGALLVAAILLGQLGRAAGSALATARSGLSPRQRAACVLAYVPKATIQAAFAALPLDRGLPDGQILLTAGVLAVVITAPLGVVTLQRGVDRVLKP